MSDMHIGLGSDVITSDGLVFGKTHQLVVDPKNRNLPAIIVRYGRLPDHRDFIVGWQLLDHVENTAILLKIDGKKVEQLPEMVKVASVSAPQGPGMPYLGPFATGGAYASGDFIGDAVRADTPVVGQGGAVPVGSSTAFDMSSMNIEIETNLPENTLMVSSDTDVITSDQKKIGKLHEVVTNDSGVIDGFYGRTGRIRHHAFYVPAKLIAGGTHKYVRLSVSSDEAASALTYDEQA